MAEKTIDVLLWGATGFTGKMVTTYFAQNPAAIERTFFSMKPGPVPESLVFAIAGRNKEKLEAVKAEAGCKSDVKVFVADAADAEAVDAIVKQARVLVALAGPMVLYGSAIVSACARFNTHYVDITGEVAWVRDMIEKHGETAKATKTSIVPMCGFDSIPSDLGTLFVAKQLGFPSTKQLRRVTCLQTMSGGGMSGGSMASGIEMERNPVILQSGKSADDVFLLGGEPAGGSRPEDEFPSQAKYVEKLGLWAGPFGMAQINSRVVRRSDSMLEYGAEFSYSEYMEAPSEKFAQRLVKAANGPPATKRQQMVDAGRLPKPGQGPEPEQRKDGLFRTMLLGEADDGTTVVCSVSGGEAGYEETAKMVSEAALALALEYDACPASTIGGGFLTPATAMGDVLIARLDNAGIKFAVGAPSKARL
jgi:short subunit dehydrogenase-like uncharacterized protein